MEPLEEIVLVVPAGPAATRVIVPGFVRVRPVPILTAPTETAVEILIVTAEGAGAMIVANVAISPPSGALV